MKEKIKNNCLTCRKRKHCKDGNGMAITWKNCELWIPQIAKEAEKK